MDYTLCICNKCKTTCTHDLVNIICIHCNWFDNSLNFNALISYVLTLKDSYKIELTVIKDYKSVQVFYEWVKKKINKLTVDNFAVSHISRTFSLKYSKWFIHQKPNDAFHNIRLTHIIVLVTRWMQSGTEVVLYHKFYIVFSSLLCLMNEIGCLLFQFTKYHQNNTK